MKVCWPVISFFLLFFLINLPGAMAEVSPDTYLLVEETVSLSSHPDVALYSENPYVVKIEDNSAIAVGTGSSTIYYLDLSGFQIK